MVSDPQFNDAVRSLTSGVVFLFHRPCLDLTRLCLMYARLERRENAARSVGGSHLQAFRVE